MSEQRHRFGDFVLDHANRSLNREGVTLALNARYFDALALLVREHGRLVGKQRFFDEVWAGSVVTDAALTQCIKEIRRLLGDDASDPRFVRTVAGHGYSFIAAVQEERAKPGAADAAAMPASAADEPGARMAAPAARAGTVASSAPRALAELVIAATIGGALAGLLGGLLYGSLLAFSPQAQGLGSLSVLLVMLVLSIVVGLLGAFGVGLGIAAGHVLGRAPGWILAGGALGGLVIGGLTKLLGSDAFSLLVGQAPAGITGGLEGALIGCAVAAGLQLGGGLDHPRGQRPVIWAALTSGMAGALIPLAGGSLMASSLASVAATFDRSRLDMAPLARLVGEPQFSVPAQAALGALEAGLFGACVVAMILLVRTRTAVGA